MRRSRILALLCLAAAAGCAKHATEPGPAPGPLPAALVATWPAARSTMVPYDTEIWGRFDRALDPASVTARAVFLKLDGQRVPVTVSYEDAARRVWLRPTVTLELLRTYTVEFTPAVRAADGTSLPQGVFFQFTTNSLRRVRYDFPEEDALEGAVPALGWGGLQGPVNELMHEVYAGTDSLAVASRALTPLHRSVFTRYLPAAAWPPGTRVHWAVSTEHTVTHERMDGPVRSFRVLPSSVPVESVTILARDHGSSDIRSRNVQFCNRQTLPCGPSYNGAIHWAYGALPANARLVGATMTLVALDVNAGATGGSRTGVWMSQNDWQPCLVTAPGPPWHEASGLLASGFESTPVRLDFTSDRLAAFLEAQARGRTLVHGVVVRTPQDVQFHSASALGQDVVPRVVVRFQRLPPGPLP